jgi:molybdenum cofactor biosynthesis enzyme MoaA
MRFPFRLRVDLAFAGVLNGLTGSASDSILRFSPLVTHFSPKEHFDESSTELERHSPEDCVRLASGSRAPVVWICGAEPLLHPEIGPVANSLVQSGRHVFLHTTGLSLRQRIHEFQPHSRLFLTAELAGREAAHDASVERPGAFRQVLESIRTAKLSGFLVCAHVTVRPGTDACDIGELFEFLDEKDVDGLIVSSGGTAQDAAAVQEKLKEIRGLIRHAGWERFSRILEASYAQPEYSPANSKLPGRQIDAYEEGD